MGAGGLEVEEGQTRAGRGIAGGGVGWNTGQLDAMTGYGICLWACLKEEKIGSTQKDFV
jgi:hypothetical protein